MLRRYLLRSPDLNALDQDELTGIGEVFNDRPMAVLAYRSPRVMLRSGLGLSVVLQLSTQPRRALNGNA